VINWCYYPRSDRPPVRARQVVQAFEAIAADVDSSRFDLKSNEVLARLAPHLQVAGFRVEAGKRAGDKISVPVLFGLNGRLEKSFDADANAEADGFVVEVEAGRGVANNQFLKDLFQACMMQDVQYLAIAVRNVYKGRSDFDVVVRFFNTLSASQRLRLPLSGVLIVGY